MSKTIKGYQGITLSRQSILPGHYGGAHIKISKNRLPNGGSHTAIMIKTLISPHLENLIFTRVYLNNYARDKDLYLVLDLLYEIQIGDSGSD